jgi:hypothetical protein
VATIEIDLGRLDAAEAHYREGLAVFREHRARDWCGIALGGLGGLAARRGQLDEGRRLLLQAEAEYLATGSPRVQIPRERLAMVLVDLACWPEALERAQAVLGMPEVPDRRRAAMLAVLLVCRAAMGHWAGFSAALREAHEAILAVGRIEDGVAACLATAERLCREAGRRQEAHGLGRLASRSGTPRG